MITFKRSFHSKVRMLNFGEGINVASTKGKIHTKNVFATAGKERFLCVNISETS